LVGIVGDLIANETTSTLAVALNDRRVAIRETALFASGTAAPDIRRVFARFDQRAP
jgi:hypothetical protein